MCRLSQLTVVWWCLMGDELLGWVVGGEDLAGELGDS